MPPEFEPGDTKAGQFVTNIILALVVVAFVVGVTLTSGVYVLGKIIDEVLSPATIEVTEPLHPAVVQPHAGDPRHYPGEH